MYGCASVSNTHEIRVKDEKKWMRAVKFRWRKMMGTLSLSFSFCLSCWIHRSHSHCIILFYYISVFIWRSSNNNDKKKSSFEFLIIYAFRRWSWFPFSCIYFSSTYTDGCVGESVSVFLCQYSSSLLSSLFIPCSYFIVIVIFVCYFFLYISLQ